MGYDPKGQEELVTTGQPHTAQVSSRAQPGAHSPCHPCLSPDLPQHVCLGHPSSPPVLPRSAVHGGRARIRCRWFSGYSAHRRCRWARWQWRPHGLKLPFSVRFPFASSTSEGTWAFRWSSDLRSAVAGLWARGAHGGQDPGGWQGSLGWTRPWTAPGYPPGCPRGPWCPPAPLRPQARPGCRPQGVSLKSIITHAA